MRFVVMFINAICVLFLVKLRWPKKKHLSLYLIGIDCKTAVFFCERERRTIFERKAGASEKTARENGERHSRITLTALPAFRKRLFCSL